MCTPERSEGDHIKVTASKYPFPTVSADKASTDWFSSISRTLRWNEREKQKSFVVVEEDEEPLERKSSVRKRDAHVARRKAGDKPEVNGHAPAKTADQDMDEEDEDDEEEPEEKFDIDE